MCPARALKIYLLPTQEVRGQNRALFVHFHSDKASWRIWKATLSRWLTDVIRQAYTILRKVLSVHANQHSVQGVATSWAEFARVLPDKRSVGPLLGQALVRLPSFAGLILPLKKRILLREIWMQQQGANQTSGLALFSPFDVVLLIRRLGTYPPFLVLLAER